MSIMRVPHTGGDLDPDTTIVRRFAKAETATATSVSSASNTIHTPASGKSIRLKWIYVASPSTSSETVVTVSLGASVAYQFPLPAPGIFMRTSIRESVADGTLSVALSPATTVYVNYELEEF